MLRSIYKHIIDSIDDRSVDILNHIASHNKNHVKLTDSIIEIEEKILKLIPENYKPLFYDYEVLLSERDSIKNIVLYKQGIADGIKIKKLIDRD